MDYDDEEYRELMAMWGLQSAAPVQESMRGRRRTLVNPSTDDKKVRRRNNRRTAAETFDAGGDVQTRADLVRALNKAASLAEQARILDEIAKIDNAKQASVAQGRELDFAEAVVRQTLAPVRVHEFHTAATDWIGYEQEIPHDWQNRVVAEAAAWFSRVPDFVKANGEEYKIQAEGKARQISGQFGLQAQAAAQTFTQYAEFLRTQAASGLDQIQQTIDPNNQPKTTPLPTEVFDNFAPEVDPINAGVSGTETSDRAPLIQEIMSGGSGMDGGAPEKPGGHSEGNELSWNPPSGMQQDTAPGWSDGDPGTPEKGGDRPDYTKSSSLIGPPSMAIGGYGYTLDDFRREAAARQAGGQGKAKGGLAASSKKAAKCRNCGTELSKENRGARGYCINCEGRKGGKAASKGCCGSCKDCKGGCCEGCSGCKSCPSSSKEAASGLPQIQEVVDANNQPHAPSPLPPEVAFPLDEEFQPEWTTNGTGNAQPSKAAASRKQADMFGNSDDPHTVVQPNVANTPVTTPPLANDGGGRAAGEADARANERASFGDDSTHVPSPAQQYAEGYASVDQTAAVPQDVPGSMVQTDKAVTHAGAKVSSLIVSAKEADSPDFKKGYGYASRWQPGTRLVSTGSASFEAGLYAGISDNPAHQKAFAEAHRTAAAKYPALGKRIEQHKRMTLRIASKNEVPTNGLYLTAATSIELDSTAPNTTPAADGSTPINGPGRPGPLDGQQEAAAPGGPAPYNGAPPYGSPVVPGQMTEEPGPEAWLVGGGGMSTPQQAMAFRKRVQAALLAEKSAASDPSKPWMREVEFGKRKTRPSRDHSGGEMCSKCGHHTSASIGGACTAFVATKSGSDSHGQWCMCDGPAHDYRGAGSDGK
jgi:hypothetical protein